MRRDLRYADAGAFRSPHLTGQTEQAWCLTLLTNAVVTTWTTEYYGLAVSELAKLDPSGFRPLRGGITDGTLTQAD